MRKIKRIFFNGGCIWGFVEYLGCLAYLRENKHLFADDCHVYGVSSGSVIGLLLLLDVCPYKVLQFMKDYKYTLTTDLTQIQRDFYKFIIADHKHAYKIANKRLHVGVTTIDGFEFHHGNWKSNEDMAHSLIGGASIPFFNTFEDGTLLDGGLSFEETCLPKRTFIVRCRLAHFPLSAVPPSHILCDCLFGHGYISIRNSNVKEAAFVRKPPNWIVRLFFW